MRVEIRASHSGYVSIGEYNPNGFGNNAILLYAKKWPEDQDVPFFPIESQYSHLSEIIVSPGQFLNAGDIIGYMGRSGMSTGRHLDYRIYVYGYPIDPEKFYY